MIGYSSNFLREYFFKKKLKKKVPVNKNTCQKCLTGVFAIHRLSPYAQEEGLAFSELLFLKSLGVRPISDLKT